MAKTKAANKAAKEQAAKEKAAAVKKALADAEKEKEKRQEADEESDCSDYECVPLPENLNSVSTFLRNQFRGPYADGRFIWRDPSDAATAYKIYNRIINGRHRKKKDFKRKATEAFGEWKSKPGDKKKTRVQILVNDYSRFISTIMTKISKDWLQFKTTAESPDTCDSCWEMFVLLTRKGFTSSTKSMIMKPKTNKLYPFEVVEAKFRDAYEVSTITYIQIH